MRNKPYAAWLFWSIVFQTDLAPLLVICEVGNLPYHSPLCRNAVDEISSRKAAPGIS